MELTFNPLTTRSLISCLVENKGLSKILKGVRMILCTPYRYPPPLQLKHLGLVLNAYTVSYHGKHKASSKHCQKLCVT